MDSSIDQVSVWTCMTCQDIFPGNTIVHHFKKHPPSKYPEITGVDEALMSELQGVVKALRKGGSLREQSKLAYQPLVIEPAPPLEEESFAPPLAIATEATPRATSGSNSVSSSCRSDATCPKKDESHSQVVPRKVAKKSCSGLKPKKHKKDKKREKEREECVKPKAIAKKSCSGLKKSHEKDESRLKTVENSNSIKNHFNSRSREASPITIEKITAVCVKKRKSDMKSFLHNNAAKKLKKSQGKKIIKSRPNKKFPKPPFIRANPSQSSKIVDAMRLMKAIMQEPSPSISSLKEAMMDTFPYRRYLYENLPDIKATFGEFPALHQWEILKRDFELFKGASFDALNWKLSEDLELTYEMTSSKYYMWPDPLLQRASERYRDSPSDELLRDLQVLCFAFDKMNGKLDGVLYKIREKGRPPFARMTPTIDIRGDYGSDTVKISIFCEGHEITTAPNFYEAILCMYSVYWIFNLCYDAPCQPFFETFDSAIGE